MISMTTEQNYYLYPHPMDMRKGIDRLAEVVRTEMLHDPYITNGVYVFMSRDLRKIKVLSRGLRRFELTLIRLDEEKFFSAHIRRTTLLLQNFLERLRSAYRGRSKAVSDIQKYSIV